MGWGWGWKNVIIWGFNVKSYSRKTNIQEELPKKEGLGQLTHLREAKKGGSVSEGAHYAREIAATEGCLKNHSWTIPFIYFLQSKPVCHSTYKYWVIAKV